jgi:hypothetical protein
MPIINAIAIAASGGNSVARQIIIRHLDEIEPLRREISAAAERTAKALTELLSAALNGIEILRRMKFIEMAWDPIAPERRLNIVEQINQTWTILVTLKALPFLFDQHHDAGGFRLNLGTAAGTDIESLEPNLVAAETFAAVRPSSNRKLTKDMEKLVRTCPMAKSRYVFFGAPGFKHERQVKLETTEGIEVWAVEV